MFDKLRIAVTLRVILIAVLLLNSLVPGLALAKPLRSNGSVRNLEKQIGEKSDKLSFSENNYQQRFDRPLDKPEQASENAPIQAETTLLPDERHLSITSVGRMPDALGIVTEDVSCDEFDVGIKCDFTLAVRIESSFWGLGRLYWQVQWSDSDGSGGNYYGLAVVDAPSVYWYGDPDIDFFPVSHSQLALLRLLERVL